MSAELIAGVKSILENRKSPVEIDLSNKGLRDEHVEKLVELLKQYPAVVVSHLRLYRNNIGNAGAVSLATLESISSISLEDNRVGDEGAQSLVANSKILKLNLADNPISEKCAAFILENTKQICLGLQRTEIADKSISQIQEKVKDNDRKHSKENQKSPRVALDMVAQGFYKTEAPRSPEEMGRDKKEASPGRVEVEKTLEELLEERIQERAKQDAEFLARLEALKTPDVAELVHKTEALVKESKQQDEKLLENFKALKIGVGKGIK